MFRSILFCHECTVLSSSFGENPDDYTISHLCPISADSLKKRHLFTVDLEKKGKVISQNLSGIRSDLLLSYLSWSVYGNLFVDGPKKT